MSSQADHIQKLTQTHYGSNKKSGPKRASFFCPICRSDITGTNRVMHEQGKRHLENKQASLLGKRNNPANSSQDGPSAKISRE